MLQLVLNLNRRKYCLAKLTKHLEKSVSKVILASINIDCCGHHKNKDNIFIGYTFELPPSLLYSLSVVDPLAVRRCFPLHFAAINTF